MQAGAQAWLDQGAQRGGTQKGGVQRRGGTQHKSAMQQNGTRHKSSTPQKGSTQKGGTGGKGGTQKGGTGGKGGKGGVQKRIGREVRAAERFKSGMQLAAGAGAGGTGAGGGGAGGGGGKKMKAARMVGDTGGGGGGGGMGGGCKNEPGWRNPFGRGCDDYARRVTPAAAGEGGLVAGGWCEGGRLKPEAAWAGGSQYGWPERHCCACGRGTAQVVKQIY